MNVTNLTECCNNLVNEYSKKLNAIDVEFTENKKSAVWSIILNLLKIQFIYRKRETLNSPVSTLYCQIFLEKNSRISYAIPELVDYLNIQDFQCYYFSYIESSKRMRACFNKIADFISINLEDIKRLSTDVDIYNSRKIDEMMKIANIKENDIPNNPDEKRLFLGRLFDFTSNYLVNRYTMLNSYNNFINGNYEKALKQYKKLAAKVQLTGYEKKLVEFIKNLNEPYQAISDECASRIEFKEFNGSKKDFLIFITSIFLCILVYSVLFALVILIVNSIYRSSSLFCDTISIWYAVIFAGIPAVFSVIAFKDKIDVLFRKDKQKAKDFNDILNPKSTKTAAKILFAVSITLVILFAVSALQPSIKLYEDYLLYNDDIELVKEYNKYDLNELDAVYHIDGRYNSYDEYIDRASYILCFNDGKQIDTDSFICSQDDIENEFLPVIIKYVDNIQKVKTEKDIN